MALGVKHTPRHEYFNKTDVNHFGKSIKRGMGSRRHTDHGMNANNSPLLQMQKEYQRKLLADKEKKMAEMSLRAQENSMRHIAENSSKDVRGYFERTNTNKNQRESKWSGNSDRRKPVLPPINYSRPNDEQKVNKNRKKEKVHRRNTNNPLHPANVHQEEIQHRQHPSNGKPPIHVKETEENEKENGSESPPPNLAKLRALSHKKIQEKRNKLKMLNNRKTQQHLEDFEIPQPMGKLTDFQKWQMDQNLERKKRLEKLMKQPQTEPGLLANVYISDGDSFDQTPPRPNVQESKSFEAKQMNDRSKSLEKLRRKMTSTNFNENISYEDFPRKEEVQAEPKPVPFLDKTYSKQQGLSEQMRTFQLNNKMKEKINNKPPTNRVDPNPVLARFNKPVIVRRDGRSTAGSRGSARSVRSPATQYNNLQKPSNNRQNETPDRYNDNWRGQPQTKETYTVDVQEGSVLSHDTTNIPEYDTVVLVLCNSCGRKFNKDRLQNHYKVCKKTANKKRKTFNMTEARKKGTENEHFTPDTSGAMEKKYAAAATKNIWRQQHDDFINTIRYAKKASNLVAGGTNLKDLPPPPPSINPNYVQCQYCERRFAPQAAERHIPRCKEIKLRQQMAPKNKKTKKR